MNRESYLYGARSGIQKGIRRGDPSLVITCFDALWPHKKHRQWLLWRMPILVTEDAWIMTGEYAKVQSIAKEKSDKEKRDLWRRFVMRLTIALKSRDAGDLWSAKTLQSHKESNMAVALYRLADSNTEKPPRGLPFKLYRAFLDEHCVPKRYVGEPVSDYEWDAVRAAYQRSQAGGLSGDPWGCLFAGMLIILRGLNEQAVLNMLQEQQEKVKGTTVGYLNELPWYCFDMHTRPGKMAINVWNKNYNKGRFSDRKTVEKMFFWFESTRVGGHVQSERVKVDVQNPTMKQEMWRDVIRTHRIESMSGMPVNEAEALWENEIKAQMKNLVDWAVTKC